MRVIVAGATVVLVVIGIFLVRPAPVVNLEDAVCDLLTRWAGPGKQAGRVVIVEIDEKSLALFGRWPWPRALLGQLAGRIFERGGATVVFDMMFPQEDRLNLRSTDGRTQFRRPTNDAVFADALAGRPAVIGYTLNFDGGGVESPPCKLRPIPLVVTGPNVSGGPQFFRASGVVCSGLPISQAVEGSGFLNAGPDGDGKLRRVPLVMEYNNRYYPSLAFAAVNIYRPTATAQLAADAFGASRLRLDNRVVPLEGLGLLRLRFRGPRRTFPYVSVADLIADRVPDGMLRGQIAIVGGSAPGLQNSRVTPVDALFPDVEIQATAIDNLLQGDSFRRPGDASFWELTLALMGGLASAIVLAQLGSLLGVLTILGLATGAWLGCAFMLSATGLLLSPLPATAVLAGNLTILNVVNNLHEKRRADLTKQQLVSTRERSRGALLESESRYQRLVENVNDAIIVVDPEGLLVFANRRFREWSGLEGKDIRDVAFEDYVAPEWRLELRERHNRLMRGEAVPDHYEYEGIRADGTRVWIEALVTKVELDGRTAGAQAALRDITMRKRIEAQYLQAQKMEIVGRLAGSVSHDFNNLLTVINGYSDLLLDKLDSQDDARASLVQIRAAGERAAELTHKLLAFSRKQLAQPRALDLNAEVAGAERMLSRLMGEDIELKTRLSPTAGLVLADPTQMHQILMNLLVNARDSMPHGGQVIIETRNVDLEKESADQCPGLPAGAYVYLGVADTGAGMSVEVKQHLFEPFFTTKEPSKGTGLGLATIYGIVQQSGGCIGVTSEVGQGTTFHIHLPRIQSDLAAPLDASAPKSALSGSETVLVVEDQEEVRQLTYSILKEYGYCVLQASSGAAAVVLAEQYSGTIHLLLTDVVMPLMNGRMLADALTATRPKMKVLFMSGYTGGTPGHHGVPLSDAAYLRKPFTPSALAAKVRETLDDTGTARSEAETSQ